MFRNNISFNSWLVKLLGVTFFLAVENKHFAFLGFFEGDRKKVVQVASPTEESQAAEMMAKALEYENAGKYSKAQSLYRDVIKKYSNTSLVSEAAFQILLYRKTTEKNEEFFEYAQQFLDTYRGSSRFGQVLEMQFEAAENLRGGKRERRLLFFKMKTSGEDVATMFQRIINNAPYGKMAPLCQFNIGEVFQERGEKDKAVEAYYKVLDNHPKSKWAAEAQYRIGAISYSYARKTEDKSNLNMTRDAMNAYLANNPGGDRFKEAESIMSNLNETEAQQAVKIAKFYERTGKTKAAAIYYFEALKYSPSSAANEAQEAISRLSDKDPEAVQMAKKGGSDILPQMSASDLKNNPNYAGPFLPGKPGYRNDLAPAIPVETNLPSAPSTGAAPSGVGTLLPLPNNEAAQEVAPNLEVEPSTLEPKKP
jgi:outer membrane protein assembly factor BamD (BamD/ComL family)